MKFLIFTILGFLIIASSPQVFAAELTMYTNQQIYTTQHPLLVYGTGHVNAPLVLRLFTPDGSITEFEQIITGPDGSFSHKILDWPASSTKYPFGTYTVEALTSGGQSQKIDIKFSSSTELELVPIERKITTQVFAPEMAASDRSFRVFVQVTSDGLLVSGDAKKVLSSSHIHSPDGKVQSLAMSMQMLHEGLYFVEYTPRDEGTYIFHMVAFSQGTQSHGSAATLVLGQDLGGISKQIIILDEVLTTASDNLDVLQTDIHGFGETLDDASTTLRESVTTIDSSVSSMSSAVENIEQASLQVNSLLFPIMGAIAVILALQISIIARRR
ncbi:methyl-accepting chemotaxis protein [Marine Group I thaumarchaeote]|uniref:Methyl-accepting chemotaxis protein n=1 Tax=Marine Group I thaumarchaeote TaxID=2511932 RepID=A0A7K4NTZ0_9ARCH|nr:methyl-accepting chemotaxis protein [Marine Group I thaumarchaeote]